MTAPSFPLADGWTGFRDTNGDDVAAGEAATALVNVVDAVDVPIVVLKRDSTVLCFNKCAGDVLHLASADVGRAARDIHMLAAIPAFEEQCRRVIAHGAESRIEFRDGDKWFVVRLSF